MFTKSTPLPFRSAVIFPSIWLRSFIVSHFDLKAYTPFCKIVDNLNPNKISSDYKNLHGLYNISNCVGYNKINLDHLLSNFVFPFSISMQIGRQSER